VIAVKAKVVSAIFDDGVARQQVRRIKVATNFELGMCLWAAVAISVGALFFLVNPRSHLAKHLPRVFGWAAMALGFLDAVISVFVIIAFVRPIWNTLKIARGAGITNNVSASHMRRTCHNALAGGALAVASSASLYGMYGVGILWCRDQVFLGSLWLNPYVVGIHANSILTDMGLLLSTGILDEVLPIVKRGFIEGWKTWSGQDMVARDAPVEVDSERLPTCVSIVNSPGRNPPQARFTMFKSIKSLGRSPSRVNDVAHIGVLPAAAVTEAE